MADYDDMGTDPYDTEVFFEGTDPYDTEDLSGGTDPYDTEVIYDGTDPFDTEGGTDTSGTQDPNVKPSENKWFDDILKGLFGTNSKGSPNISGGQAGMAALLALLASKYDTQKPTGGGTTRAYAGFTPYNRTMGVGPLPQPGSVGQPIARYGATAPTNLPPGFGDYRRPPPAPPGADKEEAQRVAGDTEYVDAGLPGTEYAGGGIVALENGGFLGGPGANPTGYGTATLSTPQAQNTVAPAGNTTGIGALPTGRSAMNTSAPVIPAGFHGFVDGVPVAAVPGEQYKWDGNPGGITTSKPMSREDWAGKVAKAREPSRHAYEYSVRKALEDMQRKAGNYQGSDALKAYLKDPANFTKAEQDTAGYRTEKAAHRNSDAGKRERRREVADNWKNWHTEYEPGKTRYDDLLNRTGQFKRLAGGGIVALEDGGFVMTKKAVDGAGGPQGIRNLVPGAKPIRGPGTGTSDSIPAAIVGNGRPTPAAVSNGEAYIPRDRVNQAGGPSAMYALMQRLQKGR